MGADRQAHALIIEDEMLTGMTMQELLQGLGFESFAFASTERQAIEQVALKAPDLVTVDVGLLDGDGHAAARAIRRARPLTPVIFVTGDPEALTDAPDAIVVEKPVTQADLARAWARARPAAAGA